MKKVILYSSSQLSKTKVTGGVRRFKELVENLGRFCELILVSGDNDYTVPQGTSFISMKQTKVENKEWKYAIHNYKYLMKLKKQKYDWLISFDVPPAIWLALFRMPHLCLMVRKDLIGYEKVLLANRKMGKIRKWLTLRAKEFAELLTLLYAERIIVQCNYDKRELLKRHKFFASYIDDKIFVQINNVNPSWTINTKLDKMTDNEVYTVGSVNGFNDLRKGCDIFLEAVSELIDEGFPLVAYIAGDGKKLIAYKEKYRNYKDIIFSGRITNPSEYVQQFDLAVVPSRADSCPNTVMEALFNEIPVIGSACGGIPEILNCENALFAPAKEALKEKLRFFSNKYERIKLLEIQKKRKKELEFDWSRKIFMILQK